MIRTDSVLTVETYTRDNITAVYIRSPDGSYYTACPSWSASSWVPEREPLFRFHSGEADALGRALRQLADRMDPGGRVTAEETPTEHGAPERSTHHP